MTNDTNVPHVKAQRPLRSNTLRFSADDLLRFARYLTSGQPDHILKNQIASWFQGPNLDRPGIKWGRPQITACAVCDLPKEHHKHIRFGNDLDNPAKHEFVPAAIQPTKWAAR